MDINEAFAALKARYGTDRACANHVGMTPQHFEALRNGRAHISKRTAEFIILKAKTVAPQEQPVAQAKLANRDDPSMSLPNSGQSVTV